MPAATTPATRDAVRRAVRSVVEQTPALEAQPALRRRIAERMVDVSLAAASLLEEDARLTDELHAQAQSAPSRPSQRRPLASAQNAGSQLGGQAVNNAAGTVRNLKEAIDFPTYVTSLITGVFQAITRSNMAQLESFAELLDGVSASSEQFTQGNIGPDAALRWAMGRFDVFTTAPDGDRLKLVLREGAELPELEALAAELDATEDEVSAIDEDDLHGTLVPLIRRKLGRTRQQLLSTLVMMGMQRVVVDEGRLHASMDLRVDARSAAENTARSQFDTRTNLAAQGSFGIGAWGASASANTTIGYVQSDDTFTKEEIAATAGMRSSVDMTFRTEQLPLDRMANQAAIQRIQANSRVPEASWQSPRSLLETERRTGTTNTLPAIAAPPALAMPTPPPLPPRNNGTTGSTTTEAAPAADAPTTTTSSGQGLVPVHRFTRVNEGLR